MSEPKKYMNVQELSEYVGISKWMIYKYIKNREIPFIPFGRLVRFDRLAVEKWAQSRMVRGRGRGGVLLPPGIPSKASSSNGRRVAIDGNRGN